MTEAYYCASCYTEVPDGEGDDNGECEKCKANLWEDGAIVDEQTMTTAKQAVERKMREWCELNKGKP